MMTGVDYYPEHWDPGIWDRDIALMRENGVDIVRIGEFAWSRLEPEEGVYRFEWLDDILDRFTVPASGSFWEPPPTARRDGCLKSTPRSAS